jgi:hypothetical protein
MLGATLAFGLSLAGCDLGNSDTPDPVDKTALAAKIAEAEQAKAGVLTGASAEEMAAGVKYVSQAAMDTFVAAIEAARVVNNNGAATAEQAASAVEALTSAIAAFNSTVKTDGTKSTGFSEAELTVLIAIATTAKTGVVISADGTDQPSSVYWVSQAAMDTFNAAIDAARTTADAGRDAAYTALAAAIIAFNNAKRAGRRDDTPDPVDKTALAAKIAEAEQAKAGVLIGASAADAPAGVKYVSQSGMNTFNAAIDAARGVNNNGAATAKQAASAVEALTGAIAAFTGAIKTDGTKTTGFSEAELTALIASANVAKTDVAISADGTDQLSSVYWVSQSAMDTFNAAIEAAGTAADTGWDAAYTVLAAAITAFNNAKQAGTKAKTVVITGVSAPDGSVVAILGSSEAEAKVKIAEVISGGDAIGGQGILQGGAATLRLTHFSDGIAWSGTGSWHVALGIASDTNFDWHITTSAKSFDGDSVTLAFSDFKTLEPDPAQGYITGSVTLTEIPNPKPDVRILAPYYIPEGDGGYVDGRSSYYDVAYDGSGSGSFSIPFTQPFLSALQTGTLHFGTFRLFIGSGDSQYPRYLISSHKEFAAGDLSGGNLNIGDVGSVSLASVTLSGTITVHDDGQRIPLVSIQADGTNLIDNQRILYSPADNAPWSLTIPAQQGGAVSFRVYGFDASGSNQLFTTKTFSPAATNSVTNQPISGIVLDIGDVSAEP